WGAIHWETMKLTTTQILPIAPAFLGVVEGSNLGYPSSYVNSPDGLYFRIAPVTVPSLGQAASASFTFTVPTTIARSTITELDFSVATRFATGATGQLYLFNFVT